MIDFVEKIATIVGGFGTLLLSIVAGLAGLWWFRKRDPLRPRLNVEQEVLSLPSDGGRRLLQVLARLENVGEIPVTIEEWRLWACPLRPLPASIGEALTRGACVENQLDWESCGGGEFTRERFGEIRIRPGEIQEVVATMLIPENVTAVRIYSFFPHAALNVRRSEDRGWTRYTIVNFEAASANQSTASGTLTGLQLDDYRRPVPAPERPGPERPTPRPIEHKDDAYRRPKPQPPVDDPRPPPSKHGV